MMPSGAIIVEECPSSKGDLDRYVFLDQPQSFYSVRSGILGFGVPAAIGLQLAHARRRVILVRSATDQFNTRSRRCGPRCTTTYQ